MKRVLVVLKKDHIIINCIREKISKRDLEERKTSIKMDLLNLNLVRDLVQISGYIKGGFFGWIEEENYKRLV